MRRIVFQVVTAIAIYSVFEEFFLKWLPPNLYSPVRYAVEGLIIGLFGVVFVLVVLRTKKWYLTPIDFLFLCFLLWSLVSIYVNQIPLIVGLLGLKNILRYVFLYYIIVMIAPPPSAIIKSLWLLISVALIQSLIAILQVVLGEPVYNFFSSAPVVVGEVTIRSGGAQLITDFSKVFGTLGRYNVLGNYLALILAVITATIIISPYRHWILKSVIYFMPMMFALILSYSRMSWVGYGLGVVIIAYVLGKRLQAVTVILLLIGITTVIVLSNQFVDPYLADQGLVNPLQRYLTIFSPAYLDVSMRAGRLYSYFYVLPEIVSVSPWFGLGPGTVASDVTSLFPAFARGEMLNITADGLRYLGDAGFVALSAQIGVVGALLWFFMPIVLAIRAWMGIKIAGSLFSRILLGSYTGITAMMIIFNLVSFSFVYRIPSMYFWLLSAFCVTQVRYEYQNKLSGRKGVRFFPRSNKTIQHLLSSDTHE